MKAREVVAKAKDEKIFVSEGYVYNIRSSVKRRASKTIKRGFGRTPTIAKITPSQFLDGVNYDYRAPQLKAPASSFGRDMLVEAIDQLIVERVRFVLSNLSVNAT
jgi:sugar-specific transcriptional regulator TrmB